MRFTVTELTFLSALAIAGCGNELDDPLEQVIHADMTSSELLELHEPFKAEKGEDSDGWVYFRWWVGVRNARFEGSENTIRWPENVAEAIAFQRLVDANQKAEELANVVAYSRKLCDDYKIGQGVFMIMQDQGHWLNGKNYADPCAAVADYDAINAE